MIRIALIFGIALGLLYAAAHFARSPDEYKQMASGENGRFVLSEINFGSVHCQDPKDWQRCLDEYYENGLKRPVYLWLGNSQLHTINNYSIGQRPSSYLLHKKLLEADRWLITLSQPNANLIEQLIIICHFKEILPIEGIFLSLVFDDFREVGVREVLKPLLNESQTSACLNSVTPGLLSAWVSPQPSLSEPGVDYTELNMQEVLHLWERAEDYFNSILTESWAVWGQRGDIRNLVLSNLYHFRNFVFRIDPTTKRKLIKSRYDANRAALSAISKVVDSVSWHFIPYIAPIRGGEENPYVTQEYDFFKNDIQTINQNSQNLLLNLENLVPEGNWDEKGQGKGEMITDFMHFQHLGHELLASKLFKVFSETDKKNAF
ncbi:hypothetical protein OAM78_04025 [Alphaproteobacteria bacterium]|nr:hypothetical protein [Alphaproteobacteria bacterium]